MVAIGDFHLSAPFLRLELGSAEAKERMRILHLQLNNLSQCPSNFAAALALFDFSEHQLMELERDFDAVAAIPVSSSDADFDRIDAKFTAIQQQMEKKRGSPPYLRWKIMAAESGAMTLFHALRSVQSIKFCLDKTPDLRDAVKADIRVIDGSLTRLKQKFPYIEAMRNAIAHIADLYRNPETHELSEDHHSDAAFVGAGTFYMSNLEGREFVSTSFNGTLVKYPITQGTLTELHEFSSAVFGAFPSDGPSDWLPS